jgi:very-short-patch-repair endonuclease
MRHAPTPEEELLWQRLRRKQLSGLKFRRQHPIGRFIVDFYCSEAKVVVEIDGPIHQEQQSDDEARTRYLESLGLKVIRFSNQQTRDDIDWVLKQIVDDCGWRGSSL